MTKSKRNNKNIEDKLHEMQVKLDVEKTLNA
jgi:hypothetical protein